MADRLIGVSDAASGAGVADYRTRERNSSVEQYVIPEKERVASAVVAATSFAIPSRVNANSALFSVTNGTASKLIAVRSVIAQMDSAAVSTNMFLYLLIRHAGHSGGDAVAKTNLDTNLASDALVTVVNDASADGVSSVTGPSYFPSILKWAAAQWLHTTAAGVPGSRQNDADSVVYDCVRDRPLILRPGEGFGVNAFSPNAGNFVAGWRHIVSAVWEEFTLP